jgi:hypothetical protein
MLTLDESIEIYARASRAWFGHNARAQAEKKARSCGETGDGEGVVVWRRVANEINRLDSLGVPYRSLPYQPREA